MSATRLRVRVDDRGRPVQFGQGHGWRGVRQVLDEWEEAGCWWQGESPRRVYRVLTSAGVACELHHQLPGGWQLAHTCD